MKQLYTFLFLLIILPFFTSAQSNYKPGYVVILKGDTLHGFINYKDWNKNPTAISFKKDLNTTKSETFSIANTDAFVVNGYEYYKKYVGKISQDAIDITYLSRGLDSTYKVDTVFLRAISTGKNVTLYEYVDILKVRYFIAEKSAPPAELSYHVYFDLGDATKVAKQRGYMQQLQTLSAKYQPQNPALFDEIANIDYTAEALKEVVSKINGVANGSNNKIVFTGEDHASVRFFVGIGVNNTGLYFTGDNDFATVKTSSSVFPEITIGADIFLNKNVGNLILRTSLNLTGDNGSFTYNNTSAFPYMTVLKFNQYTASLNPQLLYNVYNTSPLKLYISAGVAANFSMYNNKQYYRVKNATVTPESVLQLTEPFEPQALFLTETIKAGVVLNNKLDIHIGYVPPASIEFEGSYSIKTTSYQAGISYLFGK